MIVRKKKEWIRDPNTWSGKFYIPEKIPKEKVKKILGDSDHGRTYHKSR